MAALCTRLRLRLFRRIRRRNILTVHFPRSFSSTVKYSDEWFEQNRFVGDEYADFVVKQLYASSDAKSAISALKSLMHLRNNEEPPANLPGILKEYYAVSNIQYPSWFDAERVLKGQLFGTKHLGSICVSLMFWSLPWTYCFRGAHLLLLSENLANNVNARTLRTAQFAFDCFQPHSFSMRDGNAIRTVQTIRLIHAAARHHYQEAYQRGKQHLHLPINQTELFLTLYDAFYWRTLKGIEKLGQDYDEQEQRDYMHLWSVVGYFLGIDPSSLILDDDITVVETKAIPNAMKHELDINLEVTKPLMDSLLEFQKKVVVPFEFADNVVYSMTRHFLGDEICDAIQMPKGPDMEVLLRIIRFLNMGVDEAGDRNQAIQRIVVGTSDFMMDSWFRLLAGDDRVPYYLPQK